MRLSLHHASTKVNFKKFISGLLIIQKENKTLLHGMQLEDECKPYFSKYSAGVLYRHRIPMLVKTKIRLLLKNIFE